MDLDAFEFDEVILREVMVQNTSMTYFDKGVFRWLQLKRNLDHHFGSDT